MKSERLDLWYLLQNGELYRAGKNLSDEFVQTMVKTNSDAIFFYTTNSTDIWED